MLFSLSRPAWVRILPFALFMVLLALRGQAPSDGAWGFDVRWLYAAQASAVGLMLLVLAREYGELSLQNLPSARQTLLSVATGVGVFALWIVLDRPWMLLGEPTAGFTPLGPDGQVIVALAAFRWAGAAVVVPVMEELFWRSFLMRWIEHPVFGGVNPQGVGLKAVVLSTAVFALAHTQWLAAVIAGLAYAWLYVRTGKLWSSVIAHAVTNGMLGAWVLRTGQWQFW